MLRSFGELTAPSRMLVVNQFGINLGFYLVLPFLATHMGSLGYAAATIGLVQTDIKRVLAYSTISQLGYMFLATGVGAFAAAMKAAT